MKWLRSASPVLVRSAVTVASALVTLLSVSPTTGQDPAQNAVARYHLSAQPCWSPDGKQIAFASLRDDHPNHWEIYVMNADGSDQQRLTVSQADCLRPAWSPDGSTIVFTSTRSGVHQLYVMRPDGTGEQQLMHAEAGAAYPVWSADGEYIIFNSSLLEVGRREVFRVNADGSGILALTDTRCRNDWGSYSPDGTLLLFESNRSGGPDWQLYLAEPDGRQVRQVTHAGGGAPRFGPDGASIIMQARRPETLGLALFRVSLDGSEETLIFDSGGEDRIPVYSPDGSSIAFISNQHGHTEIYTISADGSNLRRLTGQPDGEFFTTLLNRGIDGAARLVERPTSDGPLSSRFRRADMRAMAQRFVRMGWSDSALRLFEWNALAYPEHVATWDELGQACEHLGRLDRALQAYRRAAELDPESEEFKARVARLEKAIRR